MEHTSSGRSNVSGRAWTSIAAAALAVFYLAASIYIAHRRPFWYDEVLTVRFSRLPDPGTIWRALLHVDPNMSFPYFLVVHTFWKLPGQAEILARLPSALAMVAGLLITFDCARRLTDGLHGLIAASLLTCSFLPYYGYEARSYGLFFMLAALSLWLWIHTPETRKSWVMFFAVFLAGVMMHFYFVLTLVPYAALDLWTWRPWRALSGKVVAGALGILCGAALLSSQILGARHTSDNYWAQPSFSALKASYPDIFPGGLFLIALIMIWIALAPARDSDLAIPPMPAGERVSWLFILIPLVGYAIAVAVTNAFVPRYFMAMLPGAAVAFASLLWRCSRGTKRAAVGAFLLLTTVGVAKEVNIARHPQSIDPFEQQTQLKHMRALESAIGQDGKQFILLTNTLLHMEAHYYSSHPERYGFLIVSDVERSHMTVKNTIAMAQFYPARIWTLDDLRKHARESAVVEPGPETLKAMKDAGFRTTIRFAAPLEVAYFD